MIFENFLNAIDSPALHAVAAHWDAARGDRMMPSWQQLRPSHIAAQLPIIWVYKSDRATQQFTGRLAGDRIARSFGKSFRGIRLDQVHPPETLPHMYEIMKRVVDGPYMYRYSGRLFRQGDRVAIGERIGLPLSGDGVHADGIIGASDYDYPVSNPDYAPVELFSEGERWVSLAPDIAAA
jgi:hypothetical protein